MKHFFSLMRGWSAALLILLILTGPAAWAQAPAWQSAMVVSGVTSSYTGVRRMATDASGNVYLAGTFTGSLSMGAFLLTSDGGSDDVFVAKWDPVGRVFRWAVRAGGPGTDTAADIAVVGTSVYVVGSFYQGNATFGSTTLTDLGGFPGFVAKLTDSGSTARFVWAAAINSAGSNANAAAVAATGTNVYVAGNFRGQTASFGPLALTNANQATGLAATSDLYVTKLADLGPSASFTWAQRAGGLADDYPQDLAVDGPNVYVAGAFAAMATFGSTTLTATGWQPGAVQYPDLFVAKLVDAGSAAAFAWVQGTGGTTGDVATALEVRGADVYLTGRFAGTAAFGATSLSSPNPPNATYDAPDAFVAKLLDAGATGRFVWAYRAGGTGTDGAYDLTVHGTAVYVVGYVENMAAFGASTVFVAGSTDAFVTQLTDLGSSATFSWVQRAGGAGVDQAVAIAVSGSSLQVLGYATRPATFGSLALPASSTPTATFLASLTDPTLTATTAAQSNLSFTLAPNPARTATTVLLPAVPGTGTATLTLRDALGRALRTATVPLPAAGLRHELDLSGLAPGIYAVQVRAGAISGTQRLVVE